MGQMAKWQKVLYFLGEAVLIGGLLWGLYYRFILGACPTGLLSYRTLIVLGLGLCVAPVHPLGNAPYLSAFLRRVWPLGPIAWVVSLLGVGYSLWHLSTNQAGPWWFWALVPAGLYFWFGITTRSDPARQHPTKAPPPPGDARK